MSEIKLKSCPFCEGEAEIFEDEPKQFYVACTNPECKCEACLPFATTKEEAITHWNTRKTIEKVVEQLEQQAKQYRRRAIDFANKDFNACKHMDGKACSYEHAIDIVKGSGVNEHNE